jgi:hypothetical protein
MRFLAAFRGRLEFALRGGPRIHHQGLELVVLETLGQALGHAPYKCGLRTSIGDHSHADCLTFPG